MLIKGFFKIIIFIFSPLLSDALLLHLDLQIEILLTGNTDAKGHLFTTGQTVQVLYVRVYVYIYS